MPSVSIELGLRSKATAHDSEGAVSRDHIHLYLSVPPHIAISKLVQYMKGKSSYKLLQENKQLNKEFWGKHLWGRGYFVSTSDTITDEMIMEYIENQDKPENTEDFTIAT